MGRGEARRGQGRVKVCPRCGSTNVFWASGLPQLWSVWECRDCGYRGPLILEIEEGEVAARVGDAGGGGEG